MKTLEIAAIALSIVAAAVLYWIAYGHGSQRGKADGIMDERRLWEASSRIVKERHEIELHIAHRRGCVEGFEIARKAHLAEIAKLDAEKSEAVLKACMIGAQNMAANMAGKEKALSQSRMFLEPEKSLT